MKAPPTLPAPGRNDPCPCGSGKKYKHCHWQSDLVAARPPAEMQWFDRAIDWLRGRFGGQLGDAVAAVHDRVFADLDDYDDRLDALDDAALAELALSEDEYLLLDCAFERRGERRRGIDWVLAAPDLRWPDEARRWFTTFASTPLRPYRVENLARGTSLTVRDALVPTADAIVVADGALSESAMAGDVLGARLFVVDERAQFGPAVHLFPREIAPDLVHQIETALEDERLATLDDAARAAYVAELIRDLWLVDLFDGAVDDDAAR